MTLRVQPKKSIINRLRTPVSFLLLFVLFIFPIRIGESKTATSTVLWEHTNLTRSKSNTVLKPKIIEHNGNIYANYGNVLNVYEKSTGKKLLSYSPYVGSEKYIILSMEMHNDFLYAFIIPDEDPSSTLYIQRVDIKLDQIKDPIVIPIDPSFNFDVDQRGLIPLLQRDNLLFVKCKMDGNPIVVKIDTVTKSIDWVFEPDEEVSEIISDPLDKNALYMREGLNSYRKIDHISKDTMEYWQFEELPEEEYSYSRSSCVDNIIATRFIHSFVVMDVNTGEILFMKQSEIPDNFHEVAQIGLVEVNLQ